jgi:YD repeat-containing protein
VSLLTIVVEQNQIENPKATLNGNVESILWERIRVDRSPSGDNKEVLIQSRLTKYDADNRVIEVSERQQGEIHSVNTYKNGLLVGRRGRSFNKDGKQAGEEFWQDYEYDAAGQLVDFKRGSGQKLQNHYVSEYDTFGHLIRREIRQGEADAIVYTEEYLYTGKPATVQRRILSPQKGATDSMKFRLDEPGNIAELWSEDDKYHVRWKYDSRNRVIEQLTDPYTPPSGCDECPLPGAIRTSYQDHSRKQIFFAPSGKAVLERITTLERDGSIASIRYERPNSATPQDAPDLNRVVGAIIPRGADRRVATTWDDHGNWQEKLEIFQPPVGVSITRFIYRRAITYR